MVLVYHTFSRMSRRFYRINRKNLKKVQNTAENNGKSKLDSESNLNKNHIKAVGFKINRVGLERMILGNTMGNFRRFEGCDRGVLEGDAEENY